MVGAGYAGAIMAERLARQCDQRVLVLHRRHHIAGNAYDYADDHGVIVHKYGPHIFHTNSPKVVEYLSRFTDWRPYEHRVVARVDGQLLPIPINRTTVNRPYGLKLTTDAEVEAFYQERAKPVEMLRTSRTRWSPRWVETCMRSSFGATRASSGNEIPLSCTPRSRPASPSHRCR